MKDDETIKGQEEDHVMKEDETLKRQEEDHDMKEDETFKGQEEDHDMKDDETLKREANVKKRQNEDEKEKKKRRIVMKKPCSMLVGKQRDPNPVIDGSYYVNAKSGKNIRAYILARYGDSKTQLVQISCNESVSYQAIVKKIHGEATEMIQARVRLEELKTWATSRKKALTRWALI